jgi:hypothetical protein
MEMGEVLTVMAISVTLAVGILDLTAQDEWAREGRSNYTADGSWLYTNAVSVK